MRLLASKEQKPNSSFFCHCFIDLSRLSAPVDIYDSIERIIGQIDNEAKETFILGDLKCNLLHHANLDK